LEQICTPQQSLDVQPVTEEVTTSEDGSTDIGIQCCLEQPKYLVTCSVGTQTDILANKIVMSPQEATPTTDINHTSHIHHDHRYCIPVKPQAPTALVSPVKSIKSNSTDDDANNMSDIVFIFVHEHSTRWILFSRLRIPLAASLGHGLSGPFLSYPFLSSSSAHCWILQPLSYGLFSRIVHLR